MITKTYPVGTLPTYKYVVVLSEYQGRILLSRHKKRTTWETQGGKIEPGETPLMAAKRELYEESGAVDFAIEPLCDYWAGEPQTKEEGNGRVFLAKIKKLSAMPESEMAEVCTFDELPENLTYPAITPTLFERKKQGIGKRLLYGTGNPAKLSLMRKNLEKLQIEIVGLSDIDVAVPQVDEDGSLPLENARKKAKSYYEAFRIPVFSCDTGLYFENVPEDKQPGVHVRRVNGKNLTDGEMLAYYSGLAAEYGDQRVDINTGTDIDAGTDINAGTDTTPCANMHTNLHTGLRAYYRNAICLIMDEEHIYESMDETFSSEPFLITSVPHPDGIRREGFPLDCLSVDLTTGKYYYDLDPAELGKVAAEDGSLRFFEKIIGY